MASHVPRTVLRHCHQPGSWVRRHLSGPRLDGGEHRLLKRLLGCIETLAQAQEAPHDAPALAAHGLPDDVGQLRHSSRISIAPCTPCRPSATERTASSWLVTRRKNRPPMTSLLSRNG